MKKYLSLVCFLNILLLTQINGQITPLPELGKVCLMTRLSSADSLTANYHPDRVLKILPALWSTQLDTIYNDSFPKANTQIEHYQDSAMEWIWIDNVLFNCIWRVCEREDFVYFQTKITEALKQPVRFSAQDSFRIIEVQKLIRHGSLEWVEDDFPEIGFDKALAFKLLANKAGIPFYVKIKEGIWTEWEEQKCRYMSRPESSRVKISQIQRALKERGYYEGPIDNILDKEVRGALVQFQKDKNLPVCEYNMSRMLRALGIEYN